MPLPELEVGSTLWLVEAWALKERKGAAWCRKKKIGMLRQALENPPLQRPENVITISGARRPADIYASTLCLLKLHCAACGACHWNDVAPAVMPPLPSRRG